jgi:hypothetical protein
MTPAEKEAEKAAKLAEKEAEKAANDARTEVTVTWGTGSRVYSKELHGENFLALAKQFAEKPSIQGTIK